MNDDKIDAPFTPRQQALLNRHQINKNVHPYTCPRDGARLMAGAHWECPVCGYTQTWAWRPTEPQRGDHDVYVYIADPRTYVARTIDATAAGNRVPVTVDLDVEGNVIGFEILDARRVDIDGREVT